MKSQHIVPLNVIMARHYHIIIRILTFMLQTINVLKILKWAKRSVGTCMEIKKYISFHKFEMCYMSLEVIVSN